MIDEKTIIKIEKKFFELKELNLPIMDDIERKTEELPRDEKYIMKYIYSNLPISDIGDYSFETYHSFVSHSLYVRENTRWGKDVPLELFLTDVVFPRINNEKIENHRKVLFDTFFSHIKEIDNMYDAVVELNYASLEFGTYKSPSRRTASPLTFLKRTFGRCGEQSTFLASLLRSFSIPARQIYTPRWAHCDDCHAWVEAWIDGDWHYLGACEPEPFLDKGWFNSASTRAMLLHVRLFDSLGEHKNIITKEGPVTTLSRTQHYAKTKELKVIIKESGLVVSSADVVFGLINYAHNSPITTLVSDENGEAKVTLGIGSIIVTVKKDGRFLERIVDLNKETTLEVDFSLARKSAQKDGVAFDMISTKDEGRVFKTLDISQIEAHKNKVEKANAKRAKRESDGTSKIEDYKNQEVVIEKEKLKKILESAKLNGQEVLRFLNDEKSGYGYKLLTTLDEKDLVDLDAVVIRDHLNSSMNFKNDYKTEDFTRYVLAPRISFEEITPYKSFIQGFFSEEEKIRFVKEPSLVLEYIKENIGYNKEKDFEYIISSPRTSLELGAANQASKDILSVAILRSLGLGARLEPATSYPQYLGKDGEFIYLNNEYNKKSKLVLLPAGDENWSYMTNWTISRQENGLYSPLNFFGRTPLEIKDHDFIPGEYRVTTVNRLPNGNTHNKQYTVNLFENEEVKLEIELRKINFKEMFLNITLGDFNVIKDQDEIKISKILSEGNNILIWVGEGEEPTEHLLTEIIESKETFTQQDVNIILVGKSEKAFKNQTVQRTLEAVPKIIKVIDKDFYMQEPIARNLYVNAEATPLVVITKEKLKAVYALSGYTVGLADLITNILK